MTERAWRPQDERMEMLVDDALSSRAARPNLQRTARVEDHRVLRVAHMRGDDGRDGGVGVWQRGRGEQNSRRGNEGRR